MASGVYQERQLLQQIANNQNVTDGYLPSRIDDGGSPKYYGFLKQGGNWYIMKESVGGGFTSYTYYTGTGVQQTCDDFLTNWTNRATLVYVEGCSISIY